MTAERPNTVAGLIEKRREIAGQLEHHQRILNELIVDFDHLDHTIRLFAPELDVTLAQPKAFPARHMQRSEARCSASCWARSEPPQGRSRRLRSRSRW